MLARVGVAADIQATPRLENLRGCLGRLLHIISDPNNRMGFSHRTNTDGELPIFRHNFRRGSACRINVLSNLAAYCHENYNKNSGERKMDAQWIAPFCEGRGLLSFFQIASHDDNFVAVDGLAEKSFLHECVVALSASRLNPL